MKRTPSAPLSKSANSSPIKKKKSIFKLSAFSPTTSPSSKPDRRPKSFAGWGSFGKLLMGMKGKKKKKKDKDTKDTNDKARPKSFDVRSPTKAIAYAVVAEDFEDEAHHSQSSISSTDDPDNLLQGFNANDDDANNDSTSTSTTPVPTQNDVISQPNTTTTTNTSSSNNDNDNADKPGPSDSTNSKPNPIERRVSATVYATYEEVDDDNDMAVSRSRARSASDSVWLLDLPHVGDGMDEESKTQRYFEAQKVLQARQAEQEAAQRERDAAAIRAWEQQQELALKKRLEEEKEEQDEELRRWDEIHYRPRAASVVRKMTK